MLAQFPRALLPLPQDRVEQLLAARLPGDRAFGPFLVEFLVRLAAGGEEFRASDGPRLATVLFDLVTALLAHQLDAGALTPPETRRRTLLLRVQAFARRRLHDPDLTPAVVAAAHHISVRQLHRLFEEDGGSTVAAWIRAERLDRCRRDLADPAQHRTPVHTIATRWGFGHPAAFSRAFRAAYGVPPRDYREQSLTYRTGPY